MTTSVYIAAFVTAYARLKLYEALELFDTRVLYFDTDSVMYVSPDAGFVLPVDNSGVLGSWADELKKCPNDYFIEFVSVGPKTYALKSHSGLNDICKAKGFTLSYKNTQIMNFDNLRDQVLHKAFNGEFLDPTAPPNSPGPDEGVEETKECEPEFGPKAKKQKLLLHTNELLMKMDKFELKVVDNPGKMLKMTYDKRAIVIPTVSMSDVTVIGSLPFGHMNL